MEGEILRLENIYASYRESGVGRLSVLEGVDLSLSAGEVVAITGKSGSGKSTLLSVAALLMAPESGRIFYEGRDAMTLTGREKAELRNRKMGFVFQSSMLLEDFSAIENVAMPLLIRGERKKSAMEKAERMLLEVRMEERTDHRPSRLSGGERQRVAIARALIGGSSVIFADEPTGNLDEKTGEVVENLLLEAVRKEGRGMVLVTHDNDFARRADRTLFLSGGKLR